MCTPTIITYNLNKIRTCGHSSSWGQFPNQLEQAEEYISVGTYEHVFFCRVIQPLKLHKVAMISVFRSCEKWLRLKIAGRHLITALNARKQIFELSMLTGQCYHVTTYQTTVGAMIFPEYYSIVAHQGVPPANTSFRQEDPR